MAKTDTGQSTQRGRSLGSNYYKLWVASAVSNLGDGVRLAALPLLAASITRDPGLVAGVEFAASIPWLLFALLAGVIVDRVDRRWMMWTVQTFRMTLMAALGLAIIAGLEGLSLLALVYLVSFFLGVGETLFDNAAQTIMPSVVRKDQLQVANGRLYAVEEVTNRFAGPPLGSFLFVSALALPFVFDAASFGVGALLIFAITGSHAPVREEGAARAKIRADIAEGLRWLWNHKVLRTLGIMTGVSNLTTSATFSIFVLYALEILDLTEAGYGVLLAVGAAGGVIGGLVAPRLARLFGDGPSFYAVIGISVAQNLAIGLTSSPAVVAIALIGLGLGVMWWNVIAVSLRQSIVPDQLLGRVNSVYRLLAWGTMPAGAALGGFLGETFGLRSAYFVSAAIMAILAVAILPVINNRTIAAARRAAE
ncbi:MAG: MFS transporter [Actinomycetota bacterium]|nr:MFS transporter [Actinomycetota bacterium]